MISEAERAVATARQKKLYSKGSHNDRNDKDSHGISGLRIRKHSRSRSKSRDRVEICTMSDGSSQRRAESKPTYQRPRDNDDSYLQQTTLVRSRTRNWKKDKSEREKGESQVVELSPVAEPKEVDSGNVNSMNEIAKAKDRGADVFTEAEMNKLGARIIKAELMGDDVRFLFLLNFNIQSCFTFLTHWNVFVHLGIGVAT